MNVRAMLCGPGLLFVLGCALLGGVAPARGADQPAADRSAAQKPVAPADLDQLDQQIAKLIEQLGDPQFSVRRRAQQELVKFGFDAFDALSAAEQSDDPEIAMQAGYLVRLIRSEWTREGDPRAVRQILKDYEVQPDDRRLAKIKQLAELSDGEGIEWLCRLVRFEKSPVLSKQAALAVISAPVDDAQWQRRAATIAAALQRARRPAAGWLAVYVQMHDDPAGSLDKWSALVETERQTLSEHPQETHPQIVRELLRRKVDLLDRLGRGGAETEAVMRQMVACERGDTASLAELLDWLAKRKAWGVIDELAERFSASFEVDAILMYALCETRMAQGNRELAEKTAAEALKLGGDSPQEHAAIAERLTDRGLVEWADREWRHMIAIGPIGSPTDIFARDRLSNSLHDRMLDQEAGEVLKALLDAADADANVMQRIRAFRQQNELNPAVIKANMLYFFSCDARRKQQRTKERELLDKALEQDRTNVEVLIALYRLTADKPVERAEIAKSIKEVVDYCRTRIDDDPGDPTYYNQIAWLLANTEGDADEAVRLSQKSVDLARSGGESSKRIGGLLDTLGHSYFAKQDYANAVKYQTEASQLDPHSQAIARQLKVFSEALAKQGTTSKPAAQAP